MYKIKNITRGKLLLFDIGIKLNSGAVIDLDETMSRDKIEASHNLKVAEDNELVAILHKDIVTQSVAESSALAEMEKRIREEIVQQMKSVAPVVSIVQDNTDVANLTAKLSELISKMDAQPRIIAQSEQVDDYSIDADKLFDVHAKAIKRMTAGSSGSIEIKETNGKSDASLRAEELDNFLK